MVPVVRALTRLRTAARVQLILQRAGMLLAIAVAAALAVGLLDFVLRMPMGVRMVLWAAGVVALVMLFRRRVMTAIRFRPPLVEVALRLERSEQGKAAGLEGLLASALEYEASENGQGTSDAGYSERTLRESTRRTAAERFNRLKKPSLLLDHRRGGRALASLAACAVPLLALTLAAPDLARIGAMRVLTPWVQAAWPNRTQVVDANTLTAHPLGAALSLRGVLVRGGTPEGRGDVSAEYRVIVDGKAGPMRRVALTKQNKRADVEQALGAPAVSGELYERLIDTISLAPSASEDAASHTIEFEYTLVSADDQTPTTRLMLVEPPAIRAGIVEVTPPEYAAAVIGRGVTPFVHATREVGAGRDERAAVGPILAGSRVVLTLELNKPLPIPAENTPEALRAWAERVMPGLENASDLAAQFDAAQLDRSGAGEASSRRWTIGFTASASVRVPVALRDRYGIGSVEEPAYRFEVLEDRVPMAAVIEPPQDESVLPTAVLPLTGEARDDVGVALAQLRAQLARRNPASQGAAPEPVGEPTSLAERAIVAESGESADVLRVSAAMEVALFNADAPPAPGDELWITAVATDAYNLSGVVHAPVVSPVRRLRIIGKAELIEQVRSELTGVREAAKRLEADQGRLSDQRDAAIADPQAAQNQRTRQQSVSERLEPIKRVLDRLEGRAERNRLDDSALRSMLRDAAERVDSARVQSEQAGGELDRLSATATSEADRAASGEALQKSQEQVRDELTQLANMLDRGQDTWAVRRTLERLLTEQRQLTSQTRAAGEQTQGQSAAQLTQAQRDDLARLARQQLDAAQRTAGAIEALSQRAKALEQADPATAQQMNEAAQQGRRDQVEDQQRQAAEEIAQNRTASAQESQQQAQESIQRILEKLDKADQARDEALRRKLADLTESIKRLVTTQQGELARVGAVLGGTVAGGAESGLDRAMIALHQNTVGVATTARSVEGADQVVQRLDSAATAQTASIVALRAAPPDHAEADASERVALSRLNEALALAEELQNEAEEREQDKQREQLLKEYRELLELQAAVKVETDPFVNRQLSRRDRVTIRAIGERQLDIREKLEAIRSRSQNFEEAKLFDYAHTRLDRITADTAAPLRDGNITAAVPANQMSSIRLLAGLVEALSDAIKNKDKFREEQGDEGGGGGGGGGGEQPLVPPIAELKLLRFMQQEAADLTRALSDNPNLDAAELERVTGVQNDLAAQAQILLNRLKNSGGAPRPAGPDAAPPEPEDDLEPEVKPQAGPEDQP